MKAEGDLAQQQGFVRATACIDRHRLGKVNGRVTARWKLSPDPSALHPVDHLLLPCLHGPGEIEVLLSEGGNGGEWLGNHAARGNNGTTGAVLSGGEDRSGHGRLVEKVSVYTYLKICHVQED